MHILATRTAFMLGCFTIKLPRNITFVIPAKYNVTLVSISIKLEQYTCWPTNWKTENRLLHLERFSYLLKDWHYILKSNFFTLREIAYKTAQKHTTFFMAFCNATLHCIFYENCYADVHLQKSLHISQLFLILITWINYTKVQIFTTMP